MPKTQRATAIVLFLTALATFASPAAAQFPSVIEWAKVKTSRSTFLYKPGEKVTDVALSIMPKTGVTAKWVLVDQQENKLKTSPLIALDGEKPTDIAFDVPMLDEGFYVIRLRVYDDARQVVKATVVPICVFGPPPPPDETTAGPFFPFGVYDKYRINRDRVISDTYLHAICRELRKAGLNMITSGNTLLPPTLEQLDIAEAWHIKVMLRISQVQDQKVFDHPAVIAYMYGDEPTLEHAEAYGRQYKAFGAKHPNKPLFSAMVGDGLGLGGKADPLKVWPYLPGSLRLVRFYPIRKTNFGINRPRLNGSQLPVNATFRLIEANSEGWWYVAPTFGSNITDLRPLPWWRNPTPAELSALVHLALAYGAKGVTGWAYQDHFGTEAKPTPCLVTQDTLVAMDGKYDAFKRLAQYVTKVKRHLLGATFGGCDPSADDPRLEVVPRKAADGRQFLYVVNTDLEVPVEAGLWIDGVDLLKVKDLATGNAIPLGVNRFGRTTAWVRVAPGEGMLLEATIVDKPLTSEEINPARKMSFTSDTLTPLGEDHVVERVVQALPLWWRFQADPQDRGQNDKWFAVDHDDSDWGYLQTGTFWNKQGVDLKDNKETGDKGVGWYRVTFVPETETLAHEQLRLYFQAVDESTWVWLNGELLGAHSPDSWDGWDKSFWFDIKSKLKPGARNTIAVRVYNRAASGGIYGKPALVTPTDMRKPEPLPLW